MLLRIAAAIVPAATVTSALLVAMQHSIATGAKIADQPEAMPLAAVTRIEKTEPAPVRHVKPERPPRPAIRPSSVQTTLRTDSALTLTAAVTAPQLTLGAPGSRGDAATGDSDIAPIARVLLYPEQAVVRNLEGYVIVEYTITAAGTVTDVEVVESTEPLLEASVIRSVLDFRYKPRIVGGEAVAVSGVVNKIVFALVTPQPVGESATAMAAL